MSRLFLVVVFALMLGSKMVACSSARTCQSVGDCISGEACTNGTCQPAKSCTEDGDCLSEQKCDNGVCQSPASSVDGGVADNGAASCACPSGYQSKNGQCERESFTCNNCASGLTCINGVCLPEKGPYLFDACKASTDCPTGISCLPLDTKIPEEKSCIKPFCKSDSDCPAGYICQASFCLRPCRPGAEKPCGDNPSLSCYQIPNSTTGVCLPPCHKVMLNICSLLKAGSCDSSSGTCSELQPRTCPASPTCIGNSVYQCKEGGNVLQCLQACAAGQICSQGACKTCTPKARKSCSGGDVYWYDSCGKKGEKAEDCTSEQSCSSGKCVKKSCSLKCSAGRDCKLSITYACGTGSKKCNYNRDRSGRVTFMSCTFSNGKRYTCRISWNSIGQCSGTCSADAKTCSFRE